MYLGIDLGTSELKLMLLDDRHRIVASAGEPLAVSRPPRERAGTGGLVACARSGMQRLRAAVPSALAAVRAIAPAGQMHGAVLLDAHDKVMGSAILWNDGRSRAQCAALRDQFALNQPTDESAGLD
jgi:xylulokinase